MDVCETCTTIPFPISPFSMLQGICTMLVVDLRTTPNIHAVTVPPVSHPDTHGPSGSKSCSPRTVSPASMAAGTRAGWNVRGSYACSYAGGITWERKVHWHFRTPPQRMRCKAENLYLSRRIASFRELAVMHSSEYQSVQFLRICGNQR